MYTMWSVHACTMWFVMCMHHTVARLQSARTLAGIWFEEVAEIKLPHNNYSQKLLNAQRYLAIMLKKCQQYLSGPTDSAPGKKKTLPRPPAPPTVRNSEVIRRLSATVEPPITTDIKLWSNICAITDSEEVPRSLSKMRTPSIQRGCSFNRCIQPCPL